MNTQPEPRYTANHTDHGHFIIDHEEPNAARAALVCSGNYHLAELLASLLNRAEVQQREIEWLREQHERLEQMVINLQSQITRALSVTRMHEPMI